MTLVQISRWQCHTMHGIISVLFILSLARALPCRQLGREVVAMSTSARRATSVPSMTAWSCIEESLSALSA